MERQAPYVIHANRTLYRWYGGKARLAGWICRHLPPHRVYVEPFAGAAAVLLRKQPAWLEVLNDRNELIVTFLRVLRERPEALAEALALTPYSRREFQLAQLPVPATHPDPDLETARRFYVWAQQGWGRAGVSEPAGWHAPGLRRSRHYGQDWTRLEHLLAAAERLRGVALECGDAADVLRRYDAPDALHYVDPPYLAATRSARWAGRAYAHDMPAAADHEALADTLRGLRGAVVVSHAPCDLYDSLYAGWQRVAHVGGREALYIREAS